MREALSDGAKDTLNWLFLLTQAYIFYSTKNLVVPELRADITERISEAKASGTAMVWHAFKKWIHSKLVHTVFSLFNG